MKLIPIHKAKAGLSKLVERACAGEEVIIARGKKPVVRLVPIDSPTPRRAFGAYRGKIEVDAAFFEPLPDAELGGWE